jgi:hypothetical protein
MVGHSFVVLINAGYLSIFFREMLITSSVSALILAFAETLGLAVCYLVLSFIINRWREVLGHQFIQTLHNEVAALLHYPQCRFLWSPLGPSNLCHTHTHTRFGTPVFAGVKWATERTSFYLTEISISLYSTGLASWTAFCAASSPVGLSQRV